MALTKITQGVIKSNENYDTHNINSTGIITATGVTVNGDLNVSGVLTYDDVTNIDSVGVITARSGLHVTGGSFGVGTNNPTARIHGVVGTNWDTTDFAFVFENQETQNLYGNAVRIIGGGGAGAGHNSSQILSVGDNDGNIDFVVRGDGRIGIGTDNPDGKLHVASTGTTRFFIEGNDGRSEIRSNNGNLSFFTNQGANSSGNNNTIFYRNGATESMRINALGNVGIGTDNPTEKLDVRGHLKIDNGPVLEDHGSGDALRVTTSSGYCSIGPRNTSYSHFMTDRSRFYFNKQIIVDEGIIGSYNEDLVLTTDIDEERIRIKNDTGRVGINTTAPDDTFEVYDGGILAPSRRTISSVVRYGTGIQYRDTSGNQRPILHIQAYSRGLGTGSRGSNSVYVNGVVVRTTGRSWGLTVISGGGSNLGQVLHSQTYDAYVSTSAVTSMINDMATYDTNNNILIVNTYDEPTNNAGGIRAALRDNYYAKHAESTTHRYAYVHAWRNGYGQLGECHSATRSG